MWIKIHIKGKMFTGILCFNTVWNNIYSPFLRLSLYKHIWFFSECNHFKYQLWERLYVQIVNWSPNKKKENINGKTRKQKWNKKITVGLLCFYVTSSFFFVLCFLSLFMVTFKYNSTIFRYITCLLFFSCLFRFKEHNNGNKKNRVIYINNGRRITNIWPFLFTSF